MADCSLVIVTPTRAHTKPPSLPILHHLPSLSIEDVDQLPTIIVVVKDMDTFNIPLPFRVVVDFISSSAGSDHPQPAHPPVRLVRSRVEQQ